MELFYQQLSGAKIKPQLCFSSESYFEMQVKHLTTSPSYMGRVSFPVLIVCCYYPNHPPSSLSFRYRNPLCVCQLPKGRGCHFQNVGQEESGRKLVMDLVFQNTCLVLSHSTPILDFSPTMRSIQHIHTNFPRVTRDVCEI